ncbi:MAG TPA: ribosomal protein S18-alanine N-acetyltransferase [Geomonas sp.]|nr:ribosomal protein S18-alanine N-acetyltransferase [Geomonas sp.]
MRQEDLDKVLGIEAVSFSRPWTRQHFFDEMKSACGYPSVAVLPDGVLAGYLCLKQVLDEAEILDVAVDPSLRGRGIGRLLVESALASSRERGAEIISLEVRVGNLDAIALYQRVGFREIGRRKRYYDNGEDAILMEYTFTEF